MIKKYILLIISLLGLFQIVMAQDIVSLKQEDISGRWMEAVRNECDSIVIPEYADTYIFKDDMIFHKGEAAEGVILFNITGRYAVEGDLITIIYKDYIKAGASKQDAKKLVFKVLSISGNEMNVLVRDYDYEYPMILKR